MINPTLQLLEKKYLKTNLPTFRIGDTVNVQIRIVEGDKERTQIFNGVIIAMNGRGLNRSFTVRRIVANEGVERTFLMHSPFVKKLEVVRSGKVRRAKLFYLRDRVGKSRKLREKRIRHAEHQGDNGAPEGELPRAIPAPARELAAVDT